VFFTNSGTEANELALMIARLYTGSHDIISLRNGYHGNAAGTMGATAQSNWKFNVVQVGACFVSGTHKISLVSSQKKKISLVIVTCKSY
jgi:4-aminobutyrate aminotransferase-like enzyme